MNSANQARAESPTSAPAIYETDIAWKSDRPHVLVVCCSDGRLQESTDHFLHSQLGIGDYDRLYVPGGPGGMSDIAGDFGRVAAYRSDFEFLLTAHELRRIVLMFHGMAPGGPAESCCAHYRRVFPDCPAETLSDRQVNDARAVARYLDGLGAALDVSVYRAETTASRSVRFVPVDAGG